MTRKIFLMSLISLLLVLTAAAAWAAPKDQALAAAEAFSDGLPLLKSERESDGYEFTFSDRDREIEVTVNSENRVVEQKTEYKGVRGGKSEKIDAAAAVRNLFPGADIQYALTEKDDGRFFADVFFTENGSLLRAELNAETGALAELVLLPGGASLISAQEAVNAVLAEKPGLQITEMDVEWERGSVLFQGEGRADRAEYEFEVRADTGAVRVKAD